MMLVRILLLVAGTVGDLLALAFLARFALQWARAPFRNPLGQFLLAATDWAVLPVRRLVPGLFGLDLATLLLAGFTQWAYFALEGMLLGALDSPAALGWVAWLAILALLRLAVYLVMGVVIVAALLSWINPYAPLAPFFDALSRPLLRPFQRLLPPVGGVDLSPVALLLLLQILLMVLPVPGFRMAFPAP